MDADEARRRFAYARVARLATVSSDGVPHLVPVVFALAGDAVYLAVDAKPKSTTKLRRFDNISATRRVCLLVDEYAEDWTRLWWVRIDADAEVVAAQDGSGRVAIDALVGKYEQYAHARPEGPAIVLRDLHWRWWSAAPSGA
ncbi:MAG: TIGR03668 family PPOX class F420-dependent oxidoreductase [Aldersonia sp.]|nr:TIGR03668 family PPOX class F420-dependent oxidoreductase [Aldersonia sp.]